jgi:hypothetical protein
MFQNAKIIAVNADAERYHAHKNAVARGTPLFAMSPSSLKEFRICPQRWFDGYVPPASKSKDYGNLLDCLVLQSEDFKKRYAVQPETYQSEGMECPQCHTITDSKKCRACGVDRVKAIKSSTWNNLSATCQDWTSEQLKAGRKVIDKWLLEKVTKAAERIRRDDILSSFIDASDKQVLVRGEWFDERNKISFPVECLIDLAPREDTEFHKCVGDLKSCSNAATTAFNRTIYDFGYNLQAAFNLDLLKAASGRDLCNFCFVVQESFAPFQPSRKMMSEDFLESGRLAYTKALNNYAWCLKNNRWPGYDDTDESAQGWSICEPLPFRENEAAFAPRYSMGEEAEIETEESTDDLTP